MYKQISCYECGLLLPANKAQKRYVITGSSQYYNSNNVYSGRRNYGRNEFICLDCAAKKFGQPATNVFSAIVINFAILIIIAVGAYIMKKDNSSKSNVPMQKHDRPVQNNAQNSPIEDPGKICVIREWNGICSEYVLRK